MSTVKVFARDLQDALPVAYKLLSQETGMLGEVVRWYLQAHLDTLGMSALVKPIASESKIDYATGQLIVYLETMIRFNVMTPEMLEDPTSDRPCKGQD